MFFFMRRKQKNVKIYLLFKINNYCNNLKRKREKKL